MAPTSTPLHPDGYALLEDQRLAALAGAGDGDAAGEIHARYAAGLLTYVRSIVRDPDDAQDVVQQTMLNALQSLHRRELEAPLRPWLYRIAHNTSISLLRRRRPADELDHEVLAGREDSAEAELIAREHLRELVDDIAALPERQRTAVMLHDVAGLPHEDLARELQTTPGAARQTLAAARSSLRDAAAGREVPCDDVRRLLRGGDRRRLRARPMKAHLRACGGCRALATADGQRPLAVPAETGFLGGLLQWLGGTVGAAAPAVVSTAAGKTALAVTAAVTAVGVGGAVTAPRDRTATAHARHATTATTDARPAASASGAPAAAMTGPQLVAADRPSGGQPAHTPSPKRQGDAWTDADSSDPAGVQPAPAGPFDATAPSAGGRHGHRPSPGSSSSWPSGRPDRPTQLSDTPGDSWTGHRGHEGSATGFSTGSVPALRQHPGRYGDTRPQTDTPSPSSTPTDTAPPHPSGGDTSTSSTDSPTDQSSDD